LADHPLVEVKEIEDLQDSDPKRFRTKGLRNLAKVVCKIIRDHGSDSCAINATGGYKAQIAIAVLMGQAIGVPVYYKHERFDEIIAFPPMPVALNFEVWLRISGLLFTLESDGQAPSSLLSDLSQDMEVVESLIERTEVDGTEYLDLSPTGQIFHETFRERFRNRRDEVLPPPIPTNQKQAPHLEQSGHLLSHADVRRFLEAVTREVPQVRHCATFYFNPDLSEHRRFRLGPKGIEGIFSNGSYTVKFRVETSAHTEGQQAAVVAALNEWLHSSSD
jgi:CRISPR-associated protein (Cas_APE2256)